MEFRFDVLDAIKKMQPQAVLITTNQGGIESGFVSDWEHFFRLRTFLQIENINTC